MRNLQEQDAVYIAKQKQAKASPFKTEIETALEESGIIGNSAHTVSEPQTDIPHRNLPTRLRNLHPFRKHLQNR